MHPHQHPSRPFPPARYRAHGGAHPGPDYFGFLGGPAFGPRGFGGRARKGDVRAAILSLLDEAPSNGYGLIKGILRKSSGAWRASPGSVYPTLQQLVDEGLVAPTSSGPRAEYALTDEGRAYVAEHGDELDAAWQSAARNPWQEHRDLQTAAAKLSGVVRQVAFEGTPEQRAQAVAKLDALRRELYRMLGE
jgi:DNA-binding PadR family transcriptional regulator